MEIASLAKMAIALGIVIGLIAVIAWVARKIGLVEGGSLKRDERRLKILETMSLDPKRRVLLIQCDETEHLVLLGANSELLLQPHRTPEVSLFAQQQPRTAAPSPPASDDKDSPKEKQERAPEEANLKRLSAGSSLSKRGSDRGRREPSLGPLPMPKDPR